MHSDVGPEGLGGYPKLPADRWPHGSAKLGSPWGSEPRLLPSEAQRELQTSTEFYLAEVHSAICHC